MDEHFLVSPDTRVYNAIFNCIVVKMENLGQFIARVSFINFEWAISNYPGGSLSDKRDEIKVRSRWPKNNAYYLITSKSIHSFIHTLIHSYLQSFIQSLFSKVHLFFFRKNVFLRPNLDSVFKFTEFLNTKICCCR